MKLNLFFMLVLFSTTVLSREIGYQYIYQCSSQTKNFSIQVFTKGGTRTAAIYKDEYLDNPNRLKFNPRLGTEKTTLTFDINLDGSEDQFVCELTYSNTF